MEEKIPLKPYLTSDKFLDSRTEVYNYSIRTFGYFQAERIEVLDIIHSASSIGKIRGTRKIRL